MTNLHTCATACKFQLSCVPIKAPAGHGEVAAYWSWLRIRLALRILTDIRSSPANRVDPAAGLSENDHDAQQDGQSQSEARPEEQSPSGDKGDAAKTGQSRLEAVQGVADSPSGEKDRPDDGSPSGESLAAAESSRSKKLKDRTEIASFLESMQFWTLFEALTSAKKGNLCVDLLLETYNMLPGLYLR